MPPPRRLALAAFASLSISLAACGGDDEPPATTGATGSSAEVQVIEHWSEALTEGDIDGAAKLFAVPSVAENGVLLDIESREDAQVFNESLPCGAELESTESEGDFITATFRLTTRPGVAVCPGDGNTAQTTFVIEDGLIVEWRRAAVPGQEGPRQTV